MNLILNRSFELPEDGWYQLAPLGEFPHSASGTVQVIDAESCTRMVSAFENARTASDRFAGLLIDFDHFSLDAEKKSEAAGWITDLKFVPPLDDPGSSVPESGLYACIRWSDIGEVSVKGGRYRFLSPVWARADCEDLGDKRLRPVRLLNAAVTNDPNLKGLLPLSNRTPKPLTDNPELLTDNRAKGAPFDSVLSDRDPDLTQENWMKNLIAALLKKLNLPADSDEEVIQSAIENMTPPDE
ncbi:MAG: phage protease, partial [Kiritimatiellales bacterium]